MGLYKAVAGRAFRGTGARIRDATAKAVLSGSRAGLRVKDEMIPRRVHLPTTLAGSNRESTSW